MVRGQGKSKQNGLRLNVFLARCGVSSRRKADILIKKGKVRVNGRVVSFCGYRVSKSDNVTVNGKLLIPLDTVYFAFYKPQGVTTTLRDKFASKTVRDYIPSNLKGIFPVGRLDKDSEGLLILTNDGDFSFKLTHPRFEIEKEYVLGVKGEVTNDVLRQAFKGIKDRGEVLRIERAVIEQKGAFSRIRVVVKEGKKRHLRRIFKRLGFDVVSLKRVRIANIHLGNLKEGQMRMIPKEKVDELIGQGVKR